MGWLEEFSPALVVVVDCIVIMLFYVYAPKRRFMLYLVGALAVYTGACCFFQKLQPVEVLNRIFPMADTAPEESILILAVMFVIPCIFCFCDEDTFRYSCSSAQCFSYIVLLILYHTGCLSEEISFLVMMAIMGAPICMFGCYFCEFFFAFAPTCANNTKVQKEDRAVKNNSVEGRATYWDPKLGDVEVYLRTSKDGTVFTYMENGHMEEVSENSKGVYQGHISGRTYYLK